MCQPSLRLPDIRRVLRALAVSSAVVVQTFAQVSLTSDARKTAKAIDDDLAKQCQTGGDQCRRAYAMLLLIAQVRLAEWGYATKFTGESDPETTAAIHLYQQRNRLPVTGKLDGSTIVRMDMDEEAVEPYQRMS